MKNNIEDIYQLLSQYWGYRENPNQSGGEIFMKDSVPYISAYLDVTL